MNDELLRDASPDVRTEIASARSANKRAVLMRVKSGENTKFVAVPVARG